MPYATQTSWSGTAGVDIAGTSLTTPGGATWTSIAGALQYVLTGGVRSNTSANNVFYYASGVLPSDRFQSCTVVIDTITVLASPQMRFGICYNLANGDHYEALFNGSASSNLFHLYKVTNNGATFTDMAAAITLDPSSIAPATCVISYTGNTNGTATIAVVVNGVTKFSVVDTSPLSIAGVAIIGAYDKSASAAVGLKFTSFAADNIAAPDTGVAVTATGQVVALGIGGVAETFFVGTNHGGPLSASILLGDTNQQAGTNINPGWLGVDCGAHSGVNNTLVPTELLIAPRYNNGTNSLPAENLTVASTFWENAINGATVYGTNAPSFTSLTSLGTVGATGVVWYGGAQYGVVTLTGSTAYRWLIVKAASTTFGNSNGIGLADIQFIGTPNAGSTMSYRPAPPTINTSVGIHNTQATVFLTSLTTNGAIYYTLDGTTPDNTKTLYTGPFEITTANANLSNGELTIKAICIQNSISSTILSTKYMMPLLYRMNMDTYDTTGKLVLGNVAGSTYDDGTNLYVYGQVVDAWAIDAGSGVNNFFPRGSAVYVTDRTKPMIGAFGAPSICGPAIDLTNNINQSRPRIIKNSSNNYILFQNFGDGSASIPNAHISVSESTTGPGGAFTYGTAITTAFGGSHDINTFTDPQTGRFYLIHTNNGSQTLVFNNAGSATYADNQATIVERLNNDCKTINTGVGAWLIANEAVNKIESALIFYRNGVYFFIDGFLNPYGAQLTAIIPRYVAVAAADFETACGLLLTATTSPGWAKLMADQTGTPYTSTASIPGAYPGNYANIQPDYVVAAPGWVDGSAQQALILCGTWWFGTSIRQSRQIRWPLVFPTSTTVYAPVPNLAGSNTGGWLLSDYWSGPPTPGLVTHSAVTSIGLTTAIAASTVGASPFTYKAQIAMDDGTGTPGTFADINTFGSARSVAATGLSSETGYWTRWVVKDTNTITSNSDAAYSSTGAGTAYINADFSTGTPGNSVTGFVDTTGFTWAKDTVYSGASTVANTQTIASAVRAVGAVAIGNAGYYANTAIPSFADLDIIAEVYAISNAVADGNGGSLWVQTPSVGADHNVVCDYVPNNSGNNTVRFFQDGANVQTANISVLAGNNVWTRINITGTPGSYIAQGFYSLISIAGPWTKIGTSVSLAASFSGTGKAGFSSYNPAASQNGAAALNKLIANYTAFVGTSVTMVTPSIKKSTAGQTVVINGNSTAWVNGSTTFSLTGAAATGSSITATSINNGTQVATLTVTAGATTGALTFTDSVNSLPATTQVVIPPTDANWYFSPYNTYSDGSGTLQANNVLPSSNLARWNNPGAYFKMQASGSTVFNLVVDLSLMVAAPYAANIYPKIKYSIDNGPWSTYQFLSTDTSVNLGTGTTLLLYFMASEAFSTDRWNTPTNALVIRGITVGSGITLATPAGTVLQLGKNYGFDGDSLFEGAWTIATSFQTYNGATYVANEDSTTSCIAAIAQAFSSEYGTIAFGGESMINTNTNNVPPMNTKLPLYSNGASRLVTGKFSPVPDAFFVMIGANDTAVAGATFTTALNTYLASLRAALSSTTPIFIVVPWGQQQAVAINNSYVATKVGDAFVFLIDVTGTPGSATQIGLGIGMASYGSQNRISSDRLHPQTYGNMLLGAMVAEAAQAATGGGGGTTLALTITKPSGNPVLTWIADPLALTYNVLRSTDNTAFTKIATITPPTVTYTDTAEPTGTVYYAITSNH